MRQTAFIWTLRVRLTSLHTSPVCCTLARLKGTSLRQWPAEPTTDWFQLFNCASCAVGGKQSSLPIKLLAIWHQQLHCPRLERVVVVCWSVFVVCLLLLSVFCCYGPCLFMCFFVCLFVVLICFVCLFLRGRRRVAVFTIMDKIRTTK